MICGRALVRNGKTAAGKQRYRCLDCGASRSGERPDVSRRAELDAFLGWLLGTGSQALVDSFGTARSFRRLTAWCWNIAPTRTRGIRQHSHRRGRPLGPQRLGRTHVTHAGFTHVLSYNPETATYVRWGLNGSGPDMWCRGLTVNGCPAVSYSP
ncbi:transposase-like zinc-binding domain-containing protein, partial [Arthrobacter sp. B2a2-09]|uniref:transposase-like zinc-binding domain-containing protein n=1 Tax=Arthrobacter sp. B2a2-09 TaxID=2952822 RepID=UPI003FA42098